jgi:2-phospho-L-lactate guanylyltransferase
MGTWALVLVKNFGQAKTRLRPVLDVAECAALAESMARDVLDALRASQRVEIVKLLGTGANVKRLGAEYDYQMLEDAAVDDLNASLGQAAQAIEHAGATTLLVLPLDLPLIAGHDIDALLEAHAGGLTISPAEQNDGTNALVVTPPTAIPFRYGLFSARKHLEEGRAAGLDCREFRSAAFSRDIDTPADLHWLCQHPGSGRTASWLLEAGIGQRLHTIRSSALA